MKKSIMLSILLIALMAACGGTEVVDLSTPTPDKNALATQAAEETEAAEATAIFEGTATKEAERTATAEQAAVIQTERAIAKETQAYEAQLKLTADAQPIYDEVVALYEAGEITSTAGKFGSIKDFTRNWAQINWFQWIDTNKNVADFVLSTDITWESASDKANWFNSGCGFVFRSEDNDNFYIVFLRLDGYIQLRRQLRDSWSTLGRQYFGKPDLPKGTAHFTLVAQGPTISVFVDGERILTRQDTQFTEGDLEYTLASGTNAGFGTRCTYENSYLWYLDREN